MGVDIKMGLKQTGRKGVMCWNVICRRGYTQQMKQVRYDRNNGWPSRLLRTE